MRIVIVSLPRALSKLGYCSRKKGEDLIKQGKVIVNGRLIRDIHKRVNLLKDRIEINGQIINNSQKIYLMLNKPRGLVTTLSDEKNRDTVYKCFKNHKMPYIFPVGRLDKASEGLLLFTNDNYWANKITDPKYHIEKIYHVQIDYSADETLIEKLIA